LRSSTLRTRAGQCQRERSHRPSQPWLWWSLEALSLPLSLLLLLLRLLLLLLLLLLLSLFLPPPLLLLLLETPLGAKLLPKWLAGSQQEEKWWGWCPSPLPPLHSQDSTRK
jgi:hypothetical protein